MFPLENSTSVSTPNLTPNPTHNSPVFYTPKQKRVQSRIPKINFHLNYIKILTTKLEMTKKNINSEIFRGYLGYQNPSFLGKDLLTSTQLKNNQIESRAIYLMSEVRKKYSYKRNS